MSSETGAKGGVTLTKVCDGVWSAPGARIIDKSGCKRLAVGYDDFIDAASVGVLVDKTMLVADLLRNKGKATLFCRPRRFGKSLNMAMVKAFLEAPEAGGLSLERAEELFCGTEVWEAEGGRWREERGRRPVVHLSLATTGKQTWQETRDAIAGLMADEFLRHEYLREEGTHMSPEGIRFFNAIASGDASDADLAASLAALCRMLAAHHGTGVVLLIDEYDAPVLAAHVHGFYDEAVSFMRGWLTGAVKTGGQSVAFSCLTGVRRISKESIFSGLNNLRVSTPLTTRFDERYGFTELEVAALATYLGYGDEHSLAVAREWYDGYRFGRNDVYNPWSVTCYLDEGCEPDVYWGNTSGNSVVGELVAGAGPEELGDVCSLLNPGGTVMRPLDLGVVFPELAVRSDALWSLLYLAGYLTTDDVTAPNSKRVRPLRIPDREVTQLYRDVVIERFASVAGGGERLRALHRAFLAGDAEAFGAELGRIVRDSASFHDLASEAACHTLVLGLMFGVPGYRDPRSNRETGYGRYDIRMEPDASVYARAPRPLVTVEVKLLAEKDRPADSEALAGRLDALAHEALTQIADKGYDAELSASADGRLRWGVAFAGKHVAVACACV